MATKGKNGKGGKGKDKKIGDFLDEIMEFVADGDVIEFTPDAGFDIRTSAANFAEMMENLNKALIIHLPHVSVEFEAGCTPKEIVDGYNQAMKHKFTIKHSNANDKNAPKH